MCVCLHCKNSTIGYGALLFIAHFLLFTGKSKRKKQNEEKGMHLTHYHLFCCSFIASMKDGPQWDILLVVNLFSY